MNDLVQRLREAARRGKPDGVLMLATTELEDAANEIERLCHDIERHVAIAAELAGKVERLAKLDSQAVHWEGIARIVIPLLDSSHQFLFHEYYPDDFATCRHCGGEVGTLEHDACELGVAIRNISRSVVLIDDWLGGRPGPQLLTEDPDHGEDE